jgi:hypothetical protein
MTLAKEVKQGKLIEKIFKVDKPVVDGDMTDPNAPLIFTITTDVVDREGDVVMPSGIMVGNYKNNAVMQWAHKYDELPIAKSVEMWATKIKAVNKSGEDVEQDAVQAAVIFQPDDNYHDSYAGLRGSMVRRMYLTGFLNAVSIGFDPQEWEELEHKIDEADGKGVLIQITDGTRFTSWELLEFSAVPVPANPQALMQRSKEFGIDKKIIKLFLQEMTRYCTEDDGCPLKEKAVIPYKQTGKALDTATWSGPSEVAAADVSDLEIMCTWKADKPPADLVKNDFKLPHHTADGHLLVKAGLIGCGNAMQGARGGVNIPDGEMGGVKTHLEKHYHEFDMKAPWEPKGYTTGDTTGDKAEAWTWTNMSESQEEKMTNEKIEALEKRVTELGAAMKAGRVLSTSNENDLKKADTMLDDAGELIEGVLEQVTGTPVTEPTDTGSDVKPPTGTPPAPPKTIDVVLEQFKGATVPDGVRITTPDGKLYEVKDGEPIELKPSVVEVKDEDEIEVNVNDLLEVINAEAEPEVVMSDDDIIEVDANELLAVINGETEEA